MVWSLINYVKMSSKLEIFLPKYCQKFNFSPNPMRLPEAEWKGVGVVGPMAPTQSRKPFTIFLGAGESGGPGVEMDVTS